MVWIEMSSFPRLDRCNRIPSVMLVAAGSSGLQLLLSHGINRARS